MIFMASFSWRKVVLILLCVVTTTDEAELTIFQETTFSYYSAAPVDEPTLTETLLTCTRICHSQYPNCRSVTFNTKTGECTPRSMVTYGLTNPERSDEELFFYTEICNVDLGFRVFLYKSVVVCLYVSQELQNFSDARNICTSKGSFLYLAKSYDQFDLLRHVVLTLTRNLTWIGLTDEVQEGRFVWEDGTPATSLWKWAWRGGQPDNSYGNEDCVEMGSGHDFWSLNDSRCNLTGNFICETNIFI